MEVIVKKGKAASEKTTALVGFFFEGTKRPEGVLKELNSSLKGKISALLESGDVKGKSGEVSLIRTDRLIHAPRLFLVGLGKREKFEKETVRQAAGTAAKMLKQYRLEEGTFLAETLPTQKFSPETWGELLTEGARLGAYSFERYKTVQEEPKKALKKVSLLVGRQAPARMERGVKIATIITDSVYRVRDLVSEPSNAVTPSRLAAVAKEIGQKTGVKVTVLEKPAIEKLGMGGLLGVSRASHEGPRFIIMEYNLKAKHRPLFIFVGKGITFDTGGISIKPANNMEQMKYDMSGAAAVLGTLEAVTRLKLPFRVVGLAPTCENMPGGHAYKPGDILKALNGKTIEVKNTDAEGRLILADALSYAQRYKPDGVVDLATLTGACIIAVGNFVIALMTNNDRLAKKVMQAGESSGERTWQLPLWEEYSELVKSEIADIKNIGDGTAGTITGAAFLKEFVNYPWVHLDIASRAWTEKDLPYIPKGAVGIGVRLLVDFLRHWKNE
ncbi:MAG: leucyl aminopeptidase [Candidatus Omnitrophica bacterium]|nr:leucyl aminopeptidase [Candidatus Omnitrophota bacterium]